MLFILGCSHDQVNSGHANPSGQMDPASIPTRPFTVPLFWFTLWNRHYAGQETSTSQRVFHVKDVKEARAMKSQILFAAPALSSITQKARRLAAPRSEKSREE